MFQNNKSFIIAEVGQNHNSDFEQAKNYIDIFADLVADAVKFQTRDNNIYLQKRHMIKSIPAKKIGNRR